MSDSAWEVDYEPKTLGIELLNADLAEELTELAAERYIASTYPHFVEVMREVVTKAMTYGSAPLRALADELHELGQDSYVMSLPNLAYLLAQPQPWRYPADLQNGEVFAMYVDIASGKLPGEAFGIEKAAAERYVTGFAHDALTDSELSRAVVSHMMWDRDYTLKALARLGVADQMWQGWQDVVAVIADYDLTHSERHLDGGFGQFIDHLSTWQEMIDKGWFDPYLQDYLDTAGGGQLDGYMELDSHRPNTWRPGALIDLRGAWQRLDLEQKIAQHKSGQSQGEGPLAVLRAYASSSLDKLKHKLATVTPLGPAGHLRADWCLERLTKLAFDNDPLVQRARRFHAHFNNQPLPSPLSDQEKTLIAEHYETLRKEDHLKASIVRPLLIPTKPLVEVNEGQVTFPGDPKLNFQPLAPVKWEPAALTRPTQSPLTIA